MFPVVVVVQPEFPTGDTFGVLEVFDKARLVFTDRKDDGSAAPDGFKQSLNYISFMPYYVASPDDPEVIAASLGWKDANRVRNGQ